MVGGIVGAKRRSRSAGRGTRGEERGARRVGRGGSCIQRRGCWMDRMTGGLTGRQITAGHLCIAWPGQEETRQAATHANNPPTPTNGVRNTEHI